MFCQFGNIPYICSVKDKQMDKVRILREILVSGKSYTTTDIVNIIKTNYPSEWEKKENHYLSGGKDEFMLPVTQEELAGMVGASRERVNKAIASFIKLRWLEQHDRSYRILDRAKLEQRAL